MTDTLTHKLSVKFANILNQYVYREGLEYKKVVLGAEVFLINITKSAIVFLLAAILGTFFETLVVLFGFNMIRRTAFGLHAKTSAGCTISSVCLFVLLPFLAKGIHINNYFILVCFVSIFLILLFFAPSDTEARPIIGADKRKSLKYQSLFITAVLFIFLLFIPYNNIKLMATMGCLYESIFILPITYNLLGRRRNNYDQYE